MVACGKLCKLEGEDYWRKLNLARRTLNLDYWFAC